MAPRAAGLCPVGPGRGHAGSQPGSGCRRPSPGRPPARRLPPATPHHPGPGGFPTATPTHADDYGPAAFDAHLRALQSLGLAPFEIDIGGLASFTSAPFLSVGDPDGGIQRLHQALGGERPEGRYIPHVTVGLFSGAWPTAEVLPRLEALADLPPIRCRIERVSLMRYAATEIGGPLARLADHDLSSGRLVWRETPPFPSAAGSDIPPPGRKEFNRPL